MGPGPLSQPGVGLPLARIGVVAALSREARPLRQALSERLASPADGRVLLEISGVGASCARDAAQRLLAAGAGALMSWGTAAGLRDGLAPGTLLLPRSVIDNDGTVYGVDPVWHRSVTARLSAHVPSISHHPLVESPGLLQGEADKRALRQRTEADAADMESAEIARVARQAGAAFLVIRAVADPAAGVIPPCVSRAMDERGRVYIPMLLARALVNPADWRDLWALSRWFHAAQRTLAQAAPFVAPSGA